MVSPYCLLCLCVLVSAYVSSSVHTVFYVAPCLRPRTGPRLGPWLGCLPEPPLGSLLGQQHTVCYARRCVLTGAYRLQCLSVCPYHSTPTTLFVCVSSSMHIVCSVSLCALTSVSCVLCLSMPSWVQISYYAYLCVLICAHYLLCLYMCPDNCIPLLMLVCVSSSLRTVCCIASPCGPLHSFRPQQSAANCHPPCPANNKVLKKHGPNRSVCWTRRSVLN